MAEVQRIADRIVSAGTPRDPNFTKFAFSDFVAKSFSFALASDVPVCKAYREGHCPLGPLCAERHPTPSRISTSSSPAIAPSSTHGSLVCKHYLKGLCKKGLKCEYLHEYNLRRMPECQSFSRNGFCPNGDDCLYQHLSGDAKLPQCEHYDQGFCPLGPICAKRHVRRKLCRFYLAGFCPAGKTCTEGAHPRWSENLPKPTVRVEKTQEEIESERARIREEQEREEEREREWRRENRGRDGRYPRGRYRGKR
ncbi:mRNA 3'-end-processing protein [Trichophyton mentagrophytes]|uniref:mRNA 3'-end-processing protein n=3 Tax=Trichophyton TaxID=5550 RepID=A0A9P4YKF6_9EURO|nr:mRNA 3'-end-processing protein yth1 [Trichophyton equinum CBS 127.97]EZF29767.1 mRNA 3'-end-processing protein yth1 [Trichophyton interdigitale H6]KAF3896320.1 Polyadenylation factor I complex, subunit, Yth1 [Trichophyton interdigitale]KDB21611.1 mRNA 3'-end-processing protein yth1 [Trichophyton interdigitale MR816]GBF64310.1 mRNA 3'-end-processing protein [Trichophyton mentagrophytes]